MTNDNYEFPLPGNSKHKKRDKKSDPVTSGRKIDAKPRLRDTFVAESLNTVVNYVVFEVVVPALKTMASDAVSEGFERLLFGTNGSGRKRNRGGSSYINYSRISSEPKERYVPKPKERATHDFGDIEVPTRGEAELVLDRLQELVDRYEFASVSDLYDLVNVEATFVDQQWGWRDLQSARVQRCRDGGYNIMFPRPIKVEDN